MTRRRLLVRGLAPEVERAAQRALGWRGYALVREPGEEAVDAVLLGLPAPPGLLPCALPAAPLVLVLQRAVLGELEAWLRTPLPQPRVLVSTPLRESEVSDALDRLCGARESHAEAARGASR